MKAVPAWTFASWLLLAPIAAAQSSSAEETIRSLVSEWSAAASAKNLEKVVSFYTEDASVLPFNAPMAKTPEAIRGVWSGLFAEPGFDLSFRSVEIEVASSGDMAWEIGEFELTTTGADGTPTKTPGKYVVVWEKQADGAWKAAVDVFNTNQ